jgi:hypothetical protein
MAKAPYKFAIRAADGTFYGVNAGGVTTGNIDPFYLKSSIVDWNTLALNYKRDTVMLGVIRSYSPSMVRFVKDAAKILRYIKNTQGGIEAVAYLSVNIFIKATQTYQLLDYWQIDFSQSKNQQLYFEVALMEGGLSSLMKSGANTNYNIPLNDPALAPDFPLYNALPADEIELTPPVNNPIPPPTPQFIYLDGIPILGALQYTSIPVLDGSGNPISGEVINIGFGDAGSPDPVFVMGLSEYQSLGDYNGSAGVSNDCQPGKRDNWDILSDTKIFTAINNCSLTLSYNFGFTYKNVTPVEPFTNKKLRLKYSVYNGIGGSGGWGTRVASGIIQEDTDFVAVGDTSPELHWVGKSAQIILQKGYMVCFGFSFLETPIGGLFSGGLVLTMDIPAQPPALTIPALQIDLMFVPQSSICRAISHNQLFQYLFNQLVGNGGLLPFPGQTPGTQSFGFTASSSLLTTPRYPSDNNNWDLDPTCTFFTCGDSLRGLKTVTIVDPYFNDGLPFDCYIVPAIYTNFYDFAKDLLTDLMGSIGIEKNGFGTDKLVAESLYYFFDDSKVIADLSDDISGFEMTDFNDYRGSSMSAGQPDEQFDAINGPLETMSEVDYATPVTKIVKVIDFKTNYRSDPYGIELTRANIGNKTNINSSSDNDTFKIQVFNLNLVTVLDLENWGGLSGWASTVDALILKRANQINSGLPAPLLLPAVQPYQMYNITFSPQRKMLRSIPWLKSNYYGLPNSLISITAYKKNIRNVWNAGAGMVTESNWINIGNVDQTYTPPFSTTPVTIPKDTQPLIFKPYVFTFTSKVPVNLAQLMTPPGTPGGGMMYGKIKFIFTRNGVQYPLAGFVLEAGITPGTNATYNYKLLCSPTVNIPNDL